MSVFRVLYPTGKNLNLITGSAVCSSRRLRESISPFFDQSLSPSVTRLCIKNRFSQTVEIFKRQCVSFAGKTAN